MHEFLFSTQRGCSSGHRHASAQLAARAALRVAPLALIPPTLCRVWEQGHMLILVAPHWPVIH